MDAVLTFGIGPGFLAMSWLCSWLVRRREWDAYDRGSVSSWLIGPSGRHGYNAATGFIAVPGTGLAAMVTTTSIDGSTEGHAHGLWADVGMIGFCGLLVGFLVSMSLLLFMFPRFLVPRHLRGERGWFAEAIQQWRDRHRRVAEGEAADRGGRRRA
jgi:hypothetical protein